MKFALIATAIAAVSAVRMGRNLAENAKDELATFQDFLDAKNDMNVKQNAYVKLQHAAMAEEGKLQKEIDETMAQEKITHAAQAKALEARKAFFTSVTAVQKALEAYTHAMSETLVYKR